MVEATKTSDRSCTRYNCGSFLPVLTNLLRFFVLFLGRICHRNIIGLTSNTHVFIRTSKSCWWSFFFILLATLASICSLVLENKMSSNSHLDCMTKFSGKPCAPCFFEQSLLHRLQQISYVFLSFFLNCSQNLANLLLWNFSYKNGCSCQNWHVIANHIANIFHHLLQNISKYGKFQYLFLFVLNYWCEQYQETETTSVSCKITTHLILYFFNFRI